MTTTDRGPCRNNSTSGRCQGTPHGAQSWGRGGTPTGQCWSIPRGSQGTIRLGEAGGHPWVLGRVKSQGWGEPVGLGMPWVDRDPCGASAAPGGCPQRWGVHGDGGCHRGELPRSWGSYGVPGAGGAYGEGVLMGLPLYPGLYGGMSLGEPREWDVNEEGPSWVPHGLGSPSMLGIPPWADPVCWGAQTGGASMGCPQGSGCVPWHPPAAVGSA